MAAMQPADAADAPAAPGKPSFIPLEANPELMTTLLRRLGLSPTVQMHDVLSLTEPDLLGFVPRPALALLLVFPVSAPYESHRLAEDAAIFAGADEQHSKNTPSLLLQQQAPPGITWFPQTIRNACGMMALLHAVANGPARSLVEPDSDMDRLVRAAEAAATAEERARLVENNAALARAHEVAASAGDTAAPDASDDVDLHYVCFVKVAGSAGVGVGAGAQAAAEGTAGAAALWELDGRRKGPINRGALAEGEDVLSARALAMGPLKFIERGGADLRFSCVALAGTLD